MPAFEFEFVVKQEEIHFIQFVQSLNILFESEIRRTIFGWDTCSSSAKDYFMSLIGFEGIWSSVNLILVLFVLMAVDSSAIIWLLLGQRCVSVY